MSHLEEYQTTPMEELFNISCIEQSLDTVETLTSQQRAVLRFIAENPGEHYIELQNTFKMPDKLVMRLVLEYGTPSEEYDEIQELYEKVSY